MSSGGEERKDILETPQAPDIALGSPEDAANVRPLIVKWGREVNRLDPFSHQPVSSSQPLLFGMDSSPSQSQSIQTRLLSEI